MGPNTAIRGGARRWAYLHTLHNNFATDCSSESLATLRGSCWRQPTVAYSRSYSSLSYFITYTAIVQRKNSGRSKSI